MRSYKAAYVLSNKRDWPERLVTIPDNMETEMAEEVKKDVVLPNVGVVTVEEAPGWTNYRTILVNLAIVLVTAGLNYLLGINWVELVGEMWAVVIITGINAVLRIMTKGPVGSDVIVKKA